MKWATFQVTVFILSIHSMLSTCDQGIEAADIEELKSEMREEIRHSEQRMKDACEVRMETMLAKIEKKIVFAARKTSGDNFDGEITDYDIVDINEGAGFDQQSGRFRAPEGGTYFFTFSGVTGSPKSVTYVGVYKDGSLHHDIADGNGADTNNNINGSWMTSLSKGEEIHLEVYGGKLFASSDWPVIFTGNLLKLDE